MMVAALHTLCIPGAVPRAVPIPLGVLGSGDTLGLEEEAAVASLPVCEIGLQVPKAVLGKGWGLFAPCLPVWKRKSHFWQPGGHSGRTRSGTSVPGLGAKLGSPCAGSCGQVPPWEPLAASVKPQPPPQGFVSTKVSVLWGLSGLKALVTHSHESPGGWLVARLWLVALTELSLVLPARAAVTPTAS